MKISRRWLETYIDCAHVSTHELADRLTMAGLEVEGIEERSYLASDHVVVGEILDVQKHQNASELYICQVNIGKETPSTIVCGAPNTVPNVKVPVALPGAELPCGIAVHTAKIRGVASAGMICAEDELGISDDHSGIIILPQKSPVGKPVSQEMLSLEDDAVLEIGLTPNRGDCLSHLGVAREVATLLNLPLHRPAADYPEEGSKISEHASVSIESPELCYRYAASVITGVEIGPSPQWLRRNLESVGVRSINNVVDVTNFVMMELGQPLHAFDLNTLAEQRIVVRQAQNGEKFTTLDDVERELDEQVLMIADGERSVGIAGVMGGQNSEISDATTNIFLESAYFFPSSIRKTSKRLGLSTDASYRFERNIDLLSVDYALRRATKLIVELAGGKAAKGIIDQFPYAYTPTHVSLRIPRVEYILGVRIESEAVRNILVSLGFRIIQNTEQALDVEVPSYRPDVTREIDLIEEIGRIYNYDNIPTMLPSGEIPSKIEHRSRDIENILKETLLSQGLHEVVNYSFLDEKSLEKFSVTDKEPYNKVVPLRNPLNAEQGVLRTTTLPGLLENVLVNNSNRAENIRLFEIGKVFIQTASSERLPDEKNVVSGVLVGSRVERGWTHSQTNVDFYDIKGIVETTLDSLNVSYTFHQTDEIPFFHPGEAATISLGDESLGIVGKLHPDVLEAYNLQGEHIYLFEIYLAPLTVHASLRQIFRPLPKFPAVYRDLALVVPESSVQASSIEAIIEEAGKPLLEDVALFDRYVGHQISDGCVGLTYSLRYRSLERTLTDTEVSEIHQRIIDQLQSRLGITLR
jgi:phenylalanyl-tRNA synthetase beta chain